MPRKLQHMALVLALLSVGVLFVSKAPLAHAATTHNVKSYTWFNHTFGGFAIATPDEATNAAGEGLNEAQLYGKAATPSDPLGQTFQSLGMHEMDGYPEVLLYEYECHRSYVVPHAGSPCPVDYPNVSSQSVLLSLIKAYLQQSAGNRLVNAYWVLDDWPAWDYGSAKTILQQVHALIQQYTPGRAAICGFGASFGVPGDDHWADGIADNFSPQGCDMVGLYIYSLGEPLQSNPPSDSFEWSMSTILPKMFYSLQQRGWSIGREPMVGIGQAFSGTDSGGQYHIVTPSAQNMTTQALSFCQHGASNVFFFAWDFGFQFVNMQTAMNNSGIAQGIQQGIAACKAYWGKHGV